ncbi:MAG: DUF4142 domain-containing protein [Solirubrobacterales bacterium]|nr:DUF4142 domain-containing protein [Solirubrobacterales bacterium]MBV9713902.1 DUF4142 domain-containing protein [Solirubrobacterales bacterium]
MKRIAVVVSACALAVAGPAAAAQVHGSSSSPRAAGLSALDRHYLVSSMQGDLFEVSGGRIALRLSRNAAVIKLARTLVKDHTQAYNDDAKVARTLGVEVPTSTTQSQLWELKIVSSLRGATFNHWFASLEAGDHEQDISETTEEVRSGSLAEVVLDAKHSLPMLNRHLNLARAALRANP